MGFTAEQYQTLAGRFNKQSFTGKLLLIRDNPTLFYIESDGYNVKLRLVDNDAMNKGFDCLFSFPEFLEYSHLRDIMQFVNINLKDLK